MNAEDGDLWKSDAEAELLATRSEGFWNLDYFERVILPLLDLPHGAKVLDVGSGNGALTFLLARLRPDLELTGVDITPELVTAGNEEAAKQGFKNVRFSEGHALDLPFHDSAFDATLCQTLLVHLPKPELAVSEMARVLRPGGSFMAAEFHIINIDFPVDSASPVPYDLSTTAHYAQLLVHGYRLSGQGDLQVGSRVPFLAIAAGLDVLDCRINDRVAHGFVPYRKPSEDASLAEARSWVGLFEDPAYRDWVESSMRAAGGTSDDVDEFLGQLSTRSRNGFRSGNYSFVWLLNPVLIVTVASKPR
jgi:SAM-dependent methyltransferase